MSEVKKRNGKSDIRECQNFLISIRKMLNLWDS